MTKTLPPSAAAYEPPASYRVLVNTLNDLVYCSATGARTPKAIARDLEHLGIQLADEGTDNETLATVWETAARLRHAA